MTTENLRRISPQSGPQYRFCASPARIVIYGGAAGGGKSFALLMDAARYVTDSTYNAMIFRRKYTEIVMPGALWDTSQTLYGAIGGVPVRGRAEWQWSNGGKIKFSHLNEEQNVYDHQGGQYAYIGFDELTEFTQHQFMYLMTRNRPPDGCKVSPRIRATCNPDADSWVAEFIAWWIDQETGYAISERSGVLQYFYVEENKPVWVGPEWRDPDGNPPMSVTFIHSALSDNRILMERDPTYKANLAGKDRVTRERLLRGNWKITFMGNVFDPAWFGYADHRPTGVRFVRYWDLAATEVSEKDKNDPDWTAGVLCCIYDNKFYICDIVAFRLTPGKAEQLMRDTAEDDGPEVEQWWEEEKGASGKWANKYLEQIFAGYECHADPVSGSKVERALPWAAWAEFSRVVLVRGDWNKRFLGRAGKFPEGKRDEIDGCFIAGTMVATACGDRPIEELKIGDKVITPIGVRKIVRLYRRVAVVRDYGVVTATPNHPVFSINKYSEIDTLTGASKLSILSIREAIIWNILNVLYLMGEHTSCSEGQDYITMLRSTEICQGNISPLSLCIAQCGNFIIKRKYHRAMLFIIRMVIHLTMTLKILSVYHGKNIIRDIRLKMLKNKNSTLRTSDRLQKNGTLQKKVWRGIGNMLKQVFVKFRILIESVLCVIRYLRQEIKPSFVPIIAEINTDGKIILRRSTKNVSGVAKSLKQDILRENQKDSVRFTVVENISGHSIRDVYNIEVEEAHCYYANRVLVGNCSGAFRALKGSKKVLEQYTSGHFQRFLREKQDFDKIQVQNIEVYLSLWLDRTGGLYGGCYVWSLINQRCRLYNEVFMRNFTPQQVYDEIVDKLVVPITAKNQSIQLTKAIGNDEFFKAINENVSKVLKRKGIRVRPVRNYDESAGILKINEMFSRNQVIVHQDCVESDVQIKGWMYDEKKPAEGFPMARALCLLVNDLRSNGRLVPMRMPGPYTKGKAKVREQLKKGGLQQSTKIMDHSKGWDYLTR